ncbi:MAG: CYTH and CHAD domain-containing protein [Betaproteobacteria bacterium]
MPTEIELKLSLYPQAAEAALRHAAVRALRQGRTRTARLANAYYDTADTLLANAGVALRVRRIGKRFVQTIKGPSESVAGPGLHARAEFESPLPRAGLDYARLAETPWSKLIAKARKRGGLVRAFTTEFERRTIPLAFPDGTRAEFCIDLGAIRAVRNGRTFRVPIAEIEIELKSGAASNLFDLAYRLAADLPVAVMTASKAQRGFALMRGERDIIGSPVRAASVALAEDVTTIEAIQALVRECLQQIAANARGLEALDDPEWVHQMRIGTRRLRSCLRLVAPHAPSPALDRLNGDVIWLAQALGAARDWDVFVQETLPPLSRWFARDAGTAPGLKRLRRRAESRRRGARAAARAAVGSPRFQRMLLSGGMLCAMPRFATTVSARESGNHATLAARADAFAAALLARRHRHLEQCATALESGSPDERHEVRIAAKRLRYVAEFFAPLFPRKRGRAYLKALTVLQDVLGCLNDAATALRIANESGGTADDAATGAVRGWVAAQAAALEPEIASAWRRFARAKPFWIRNRKGAIDA